MAAFIALGFDNERVVDNERVIESSGLPGNTVKPAGRDEHQQRARHDVGDTSS